MEVGKALWQNLKSLVDSDKRIFKVEEDINAAKNALDNEYKILSRSKISLENKKNVCLQLQKKFDNLELQAKAFEEEERDKKDRLDYVKNQKEYKSLEHEIEILRRERINLDNQITEGWYQLELVKNEYESIKDQIAQKEKQICIDVATKEELVRDLTAKLDALKEERTVISGKIPEEWLSKYERMKHSVEDPIVPVVNGSCSSCFYSVLYQDLLKLKRSGVLPCRNCYRFLYYDEEEEKALLQAKY